MANRFEYATKEHIEEILPLCFQILHTNMNVIAPTGNTYEKDFRIWFSHILPAMQKEPRRIVLMYNANMIVGYFQYYVSNNTLMMEEIQIKPEYQGTGLFRSFYTWLVNQLPKDIQFVAAYSNKNNIKSQNILEHLGLVKCGENKNGNSYYYKGDYADLLKVFLR